MEYDDDAINEAKDDPESVDASEYSNMVGFLIDRGRYEDAKELAVSRPGAVSEDMVAEAAGRFRELYSLDMDDPPDDIDEARDYVMKAYETDEGSDEIAAELERIFGIDPDAGD